jgi:hypothetical protein
MKAYRLSSRQIRFPRNQPTTSTPTSSSTVPSLTNGLSSGVKIGIGLGIPFAYLVMGFVAFFTCFRRCRKARTVLPEYEEFSRKTELVTLDRTVISKCTQTIGRTSWRLKKECEKRDQHVTNKAFV